VTKRGPSPDLLEVDIHQARPGTIVVGDADAASRRCPSRTSGGSASVVAALGHGLANTKISSEAPSWPCLVCCILLLDAALFVGAHDWRDAVSVLNGCARTRASRDVTCRDQARAAIYVAIPDQLLHGRVVPTREPNVDGRVDPHYLEDYREGTMVAKCGL
jgi:hypothetical protein